MKNENWSWIGDWAGRRALLTPDRVAVFDNTTGDSYSYAEMDRRANRLARLLLDLGLSRGDRVATFSKNRIECIDLFLACGKIGAILVPLNIRLAPREVEYLVKKTDPRAIVYDPQLKEPFNNMRDLIGEREFLVMGEARVGADRTLGAEMRRLSSESVERPELNFDDPALIVFTGGTTGLPKGAVLSHRLVFWNSVNTITSWGLRPDDVQPLLFPLFHTGGWNVLLVPFYHMGAKTILMGDFDPAETLRVIESQRCTIVIGVPTMFQMIAQHELFEKTDLGSVRVFISGGAPCPVAIMERYWARGKDFKMGYGLTEVGPNNFYLPESEIRRKPTSVGFPVFHCDTKIVDKDGTPVPVGEVGDLLLRGPHIFSGYWDEPEETAKTIEPDGWVHTGDLARVDEEGFYYIVGRSKDMFISGGENVYPTEIEELLYQHPAVLEAAVIGIPDEKWGEVGKAVIVVKPGHSLAADEIREYLKERLAKYKIPKVYEFRDSLPKSAAGKILKRELK
ncbi:MAG: long-chain fatty acid--CoA ligase [Candidatus Thorarchaeota archaeon]|nr:MAG: long-chain fatty acid--CoA ligase [Candidatus Thorarchaeota archaeon]